MLEVITAVASIFFVILIVGVLVEASHKGISNLSKSDGIAFGLAVVGFLLIFSGII